MNTYIHGYSDRESERLSDQSGILEELLHSGTSFPAGSRVLEAGCGVGAQTQFLISRSPDADFTCIDISEESLAAAKRRMAGVIGTSIHFQQASIYELPFEDESFDHVFICFVLEHLDDPHKALLDLKRVMKVGGTMTSIEGDHGSCFWHPETELSLKVWDCLINAQFELGHNPNIGRQVYPLLANAGFDVQNVFPAWLYADQLKPKLMDGMVNRIIVPMVQTAKEKSLDMGLCNEADWAQGIRELEQSGIPPEGTFFYTWFKALAVKL